MRHLADAQIRRRGMPRFLAENVRDLDPVKECMNTGTAVAATVIVE
jgi:hypothetical protein